MGIDKEFQKMTLLFVIYLNCCSSLISVYSGTLTVYTDIQEVSLVRKNTDCYTYMWIKGMALLNYKLKF